MYSEYLVEFFNFKVASVFKTVLPELMFSSERIAEFSKYRIKFVFYSYYLIYQQQNSDVTSALKTASEMMEKNKDKTIFQCF